MVLLAAIPGSGSYEAPQTKLPCPTNRDRFEVNSNWMKMDAYFIPRMIFHLFHPRSPLSSTALVRSAFFSASCPTEIVVACEDNMAKWESMVWPMSMMWKFVDPTAVMRGISGEGVGGDGRKILIVNGEEDQLVGVRIGTDLAECYRKASDGGEERVLYMGLKGSGHHLMLDTKWEDGAGLILGWLE